MNNLGIRTKLLSFISLLCFVLLAIIVFSYVSTQRMAASMDEALDVHFAGVSEAGELRGQVNAVRAEDFAMLGAEEESRINNHRREIDSLAESIDASIAVMEELLALDTARSRLIETIRETWTELRAAQQDEIIPAIQEGNHRAARELVTGIQEDRFFRIRDAIEDLVVEKNDDFEGMVAESRQGADGLQGTMIGAGLLAIALVAFAVMFVQRLTKPIGELAEAADSIAKGDVRQQIQHTSGDELGVLAQSFRDLIAYVQAMAESAQRISKGDLNVNVSTRSNDDVLSHSFNEMMSYIHGVAESASRLSVGDMSVRVEARSEQDLLSQNFNQTLDYIREIAEAASKLKEGDLTVRVEPRSESDVLSRNFNEAVESLRQMGQRSNEAVSSITASTNETMSGVSELSTAAQQQSAAVSETTSTVEEMRQSSEEVAERAKHVAEIAKETEDAAEEGQTVIEQTVEGMRKISERIEQIARSILSLSEQTQAVGKITSSVNDIAEQSKMLAFNASIEAAKAGEFGKGFAVVATEIRNLAEQSKGATGQIAEILSDIQKAANQSVMVTEEGSKEAERGMELANTSGERIGMIGESIRKTAQTAAQIESATTQQARGMDQIANAMGNVNEATNQALASSKQMERAMQDLTALGEQLNASVSVYRLD